MGPTRHETVGRLRVTSTIGAWIGSALDRVAVVPRWRVTSVALAALLLVMPIASWRKRAFGPLSILGVEVLALVGIAAGWIVLDRLVARRMSFARCVLAMAAIAIGGWLASWVLSGQVHVLARWQGAGTVLAVAFLFGGLIRGRDAARGVTSLVVIAAGASWLTWDFWRVPNLPLRDLNLYLHAGATALAGESPYLTAPITSAADKNDLPFVYPPFTLPLFELFASMPPLVADALWVGASLAAVVAAFWLLGVRGRWLVVLLAWPVVAQGIAVGNVASFTFLLYALGYRAGAAVVLSGAFKVQSMIPSLWLVRERRWRRLIEGIVIVAIIAAVSVPIVGIGTWLAWPDGLRHFQESLARIPQLESRSIGHAFGPVLAVVAGVAAVGFALLARGRNGLARFGLASVIASPTLYLHGFSPLLAGMLVLGPELLWFALAMGAWLLGPWLMILVGLALLRVRGGDLRIPGDLSRARADVHPAGRVGQVWPE